MSLCKCGCGGEAEPGNMYIHGHNLRVKNPSKDPDFTQKIRKTRKTNKEIKEGKRSAPELPFCKCGCGGRVARLGNEYIQGHNTRDNNPAITVKSLQKKNEIERLNKLIKEGKMKLPFCACGCGGRVAKLGNKYIQYHHLRGVKFSEIHKKRISETRKEKYAKGEIKPPWNKGETKDTDERLMGVSIKNKGKKAWNEGLTKETDESVMRGAEGTSRGLKKFYQTEEGKDLKNFLSLKNIGKGNPFYGRIHTEVTKLKISKANKGNPSPTKGRTRSIEARKRQIATRKLNNKPSGFKGKKHTDMTKKKQSIAKIGKKRSIESVEKQIKTRGTKYIGENAPFFGHMHTEEAKESIRKILSIIFLGERNPMYGRHHTDATKQLLSEASIRNLKSGIYNKKPTDIELLFQEICQKYNLPFRYVGNRQFWIGRQNPDFIDSNGRKIVVELLGDWWHSALLNRRVQDDDLKKREQHYKRYGWKVIFIWGSDIKRPEGEKFVLSLLKKEGVINI